MVLKQCVVVLVLMCSAALVHSGCQSEPAPELPDLETALHSDMLRAMDAVKRYIAKQEAYLNCVDSVQEYNSTVKEMHRVANRFNSLTRRYKARREAVNMFTDLAMISVDHWHLVEQ